MHGDWPGALRARGAHFHDVPLPFNMLYPVTLSRRAEEDQRSY